MERHFEDSAAANDAHQVGKTAEKVVETTVKLTIEAFFLYLQSRKDKLKVSFRSTKDSVFNVKEAMKLGGDDKFLRKVVNAHSSTQNIARNNPDKLKLHQDRVIDRAKTERLIEGQANTPEFAQELAQQQKQEQKQSQSQGLGF